MLNRIKPPNFITRTPRSLEDVKYWKASELRNFLICRSPLVLKNHYTKNIKTIFYFFFIP